MKGHSVNTSVLALLSAAVLLASAAPATSQTISVSSLGTGNQFARTGILQNKTVVSNQYGFFATYVLEADEALSHARWYLVRSTDGGATFPTIVHRSCPNEAQLTACPGGPPPVLETDRDGNIYLIYSETSTNKAYFMRFPAANSFANPTTLELPDGAAQKYAAVIDESRGRLYYVANNFRPAPPTNIGTTMWLFTIPLNGTTYTKARLTVPGVTHPVPNWGPYPVEAHYPHLYLDEHDHLYVAWTTSYWVPAPEITTWNYYSINFMRSRDGAATWEKLDGTSITLPVAAGGPTSPTNEATVEQNKGAYLWTIVVKQGKIHLFYRDNSKNELPMHHVRYDIVSGQREDTTPSFGGTSYQLSALHGSCATRREFLDSTIFCVSQTGGAQANLAMVVSYDNGETWQDYALRLPAPSCDQCHYGVNTARQLTEGGYLIGTFTDIPVENGPAYLRFFSVPVPGPSTMAFTDATVTASSTLSPFSVSNAADENPGTYWFATVANHAWIQLDLLTVKEVRYVKWTGTTSANAPAHYSLDASNDGVNWRTINVRTSGYPIVNGAEPVFVNARYLRLTTTKVNDGTYYPLGLAEFWAEGAQLPTQPPATSRLSLNWVDMGTQAPGYPGWQAVDGNSTTAWVDTTPNNAWIQIDLGSVREVTRLKWLGAAGNPAGAHSPANYVIKVSSDHTNWTTLTTRTSPAGVIDGDELIAATARYIELGVTKVGDGTGYTLGLREFWAEGPPVP